MSDFTTKLKNWRKKLKARSEDKAFERELLKRYDGKKDTNLGLVRQKDQILREDHQILRELALQVIAEVKDERAMIPPKPPSKFIKTFLEFYEGAKVIADFINFGFIKLLKREDRAEVVRNPLIQLALFLNLCACGIVFFKTSLEYYYLIFLTSQFFRGCVFIGSSSLYLEKQMADKLAENDGVVRLEKDIDDDPEEAGGRTWVKQRIPRRY